MDQAKQRLKVLSEEKISKALLKLGIPTMVGMLVSALYNALNVKVVVSNSSNFICASTDYAPDSTVCSKWAA